MNWYYALGSEQVGPVSDAEFQSAVAAGTVTDETLVWNQTMSDWKPYGEVKYAQPVTPVLTPEPAAEPAWQQPLADAPVQTLPGAAGMAACAECGTPYPVDEMVAFRGNYICPRCKPVYFQRIQEGAAGAPMRYAGFWIRLAAKFVDGLIVGIPFMIVFFVIMFASGAMEESAATSGFEGLLQLLGYVIGLAYNVYFLGAHGATPGKMICGLRVIRTNAEPLSYGRALGRSLAEILSGLFCYIGYIMAGFDAQKRALHDHMADTRVVYK